MKANPIAEYTVAEYTDAPSGIRYRECLQLLPDEAGHPTRVAVYAVGNCRKCYSTPEWRHNRLAQADDYIRALVMARHTDGCFTCHTVTDYRERFHVAALSSTELRLDGEVVAVRERNGDVRVTRPVPTRVYDAAAAAVRRGLTPGGTSATVTEDGRAALAKAANS